MLEKTFDPAEAEPRLYKAWEASGAFQPRGQGAPFCIVIPPPNVTGSLHIGHALNNTLQDILARFERMRGRRVLWQPGTDHAGIATQMVVERKLAEEGNVGRRDMERDEFIERVWKWKEESGGIILNQLRRLGASCDWSRDRFTMDRDEDGQMNRAVREVFVRLYKEKLIYRDKRLVNWDPHFQTAISDLEVEHREEQGKFWHFAYPLADGSSYRYVEKDGDGNVVVDEERDYIVIATTRPETMLGDMAVAVNPEDERYRSLVGKLVRLPIANIEIPVLADEHADPTQGSGAVKVTPAHDFNDFDVWRRHCERDRSARRLALVNIFDPQARLKSTFWDDFDFPRVEAGAKLADEGLAGSSVSEARIPQSYRGLDRKKAREKILVDMEALGLLKKTEDRTIMVPYGDRSNVVIEPYLTDQWYVDAKTLAQPAIAAVREGWTKFTPESWAKTYFNWMEKIEPWCVSRQLWWGHRIPAWYGPAYEIFVAETEEVAIEQARAKYRRNDVRIANANDTIARGLQVPEDSEIVLARDEDVLDTWFSSALWPFSTLGWPEKTPELKAFYPTSVLVTAFDIIFFWVARMMMMGLKFCPEEKTRPEDRVPFKDVYIHALVRDEKGQKMSKSKGNVIDPLELIDEYGADALRFTLAALAAQGRDIRMSKARVEGYRNFGTKIWNAARFAEHYEAKPVPGWDPASAKETLNRWIVGEAVAAVRTVTEAIEAYKFNEAAAAVYAFAWNTFCDWYVELTKPALNGPDGPVKDETRACVAWTLETLLKLVHPFAPFVTEELWAKTAGEAGRDSLLITAPWPELPLKLVDPAAGEEIDWLVKLISEIRSVRADVNAPPSAKAPLVVVGASKATRERLARHEASLLQMVGLSGWSAEKSAPKGAVQLVVDEATFALPLGDLVDLDAERTRLGKEIERLDGEIARLVKKLSNEKFVANAPEDVVAAERDKQAGYEAQKAKLAAALARLKGGA
jgi:valyl-tRNA synthetase